jgi:putative DNA primase/helicase
VHVNVNIFLTRQTRADTTEGFFSRWVVVPFTAFFPAGVADTTLVDRLTRQTVLQGLLRASVGGLQQVMRRGRFALPPSVTNATERFKMEADPLRGFIEERLRMDPHAYTPRTDIYNAYGVWSSLNGFHPMSAQRFYESFMAAAVDMATIPIRPATVHGLRTIKGISLQ